MFHDARKGNPFMLECSTCPSSTSKPPLRAFQPASPYPNFPTFNSTHSPELVQRREDTARLEATLGRFPIARRRCLRLLPHRLWPVAPKEDPLLASGAGNSLQQLLLPGISADRVFLVLLVLVPSEARSGGRGELFPADLARRRCPQVVGTGGRLDGLSFFGGVEKSGKTIDQRDFFSWRKWTRTTRESTVVTVKQQGTLVGQHGDNNHTKSTAVSARECA